MHITQGKEGICWRVSFNVGDIRPIVVTYHLSKMVEKTLLHRIKLGSWHLLETQYYQTGFKDG